jgi:hypothetical protein
MLSGLSMAAHPLPNGGHRFWTDIARLRINRTGLAGHCELFNLFKRHLCLGWF